MGKMTAFGKTSHTIKAILADERPRTSDQLANEAVLAAATIRQIILKMHETKQIHIAAWNYSYYGRPMALYKLGHAEDAPKPPHQPTPPKKPLSVRDVLEEERARAQRTKEELQRPAFRHPWDEWLFGPAPVIASTHQFTRRICRMDMTITADEMEAMT